MALVCPATTRSRRRPAHEVFREAVGGARREHRPADVRLERVVKRFDDVVAVDGISLEIPAGSFFALLGPSGCGKTTTLRMIGGFEEPDDGRDLPRRARRRRPAAVQARRQHGLPELRALPAPVDLRERRLRPRAARASTSSELQRPRRRRCCGSSASRALGTRKPRQLSGGQQQRVALARALVNRPRVLLLDEPLGALDLKLRKQMQLELKRIQHELGITFVHVTHDQEEAMTMADTIAVMNRGRIEQLGPPTELYERPATAVRRRLPRRLEPARAGVAEPAPCRLESGDELVRAHVDGRSGAVAAGVRPGEGPARRGRRRERAARARSRRPRTSASRRRYVVETPAGTVQVFVAERRRRRAAPPAPGAQVT